MGIRFDKDTRRATNGPMIFFSDPSAEISLGEEIRGAIESRLSFYAYRRPGDMMITYGSSEGVVEGIGVPGSNHFYPKYPTAIFVQDIPLHLRNMRLKYGKSRRYWLISDPGK